jgi:hypothetical protein
MIEGWGEAQVVEHLPGKWETLSSIPTTVNHNKNNNRYKHLRKKLQRVEIRKTPTSTTIVVKFKKLSNKEEIL